MARVTLFVVILLLVLVSVGLVVASPWALNALGNATEVDWSRLSNIGQTYGAVSAIIAAIALVGVATSLMIQSREAKAARKNALRGLHTELMRMAMDEPRYMECLGPYVTESFDTEAQFTYVNLLVSHLHSVYEIGEMPDIRLHANAASLFAGAPGRQYWEEAGSFWRDNYSGRRARRFHQVLEETYQEAIKKPPSRPPVPTTGAPTPAGSDRRWVAVAVGVAAMVEVLRRLRARRQWSLSAGGVASSRLAAAPRSSSWSRLSWPRVRTYSSREPKYRVAWSLSWSTSYRIVTSDLISIQFDW